MKNLGKIEADYFIANEAWITDSLGEWIDFNVAVIEDITSDDFIMALIKHINGEIWK